MGLAFWSRAQADPGWTALIEPDGTQRTAGELLARVNQLTNALRGLGLRPGDGIAVLLPNGGAALEIYLAALQGGWYYTPINWHFTPPEIAYIVADSEAKAFFVHERYAAAGSAAADLAGLPAGARLSLRHDPRVPPGHGPARRAACHHARGPRGGLDHALHLGHHRPPQGSAPGPVRDRPGRRGGADHRPAPDVRRPARPAQRAPGHLPELPHRGDPVRRRGHPPGPHPRVHGQLGRRDRAGLRGAVPGDEHAHGAHPVQADAHAAGGHPAPLRRVLHALDDPRCGALPGAAQAGHARVVGPAGV